jgi:membrane protein
MPVGECFGIDYTAAMADDSAGGPYSFSALKEAGTDFLADDALTQAAAVAYYTALSFAPLLVLVTLLVGFVAGPEGEKKVVDEVAKLMGPGAGDVVGEIMGTGEETAEDTPSTGSDQADQQMQAVQGGGFSTLTGIVGILAILWSASGVFGQLQAALNKVWDVEAKPGQGILGYLRKRLLSVGVVFSIGFLLLASLLVTAVLNAVFTGGMLWQIVNFLVSLGVYIALFGLIYKFLPDVNIPWKAVWFGAIVTSVLFAVGKLLIGLYLGNSNVGGGYGGAGSVVVLLVWVYYSAVIVFFGAELTQVWAKRTGHRITPDEHARPETPKSKQPAHGGDAA